MNNKVAGSGLVAVVGVLLIVGADSVAALLAPCSAGTCQAAGLAVLCVGSMLPAMTAWRRVAGSPLLRPDPLYFGA